MSISQSIKTELMSAVKSKNTARCSILRVALGEIQTQESRSKSPFTETQYGNLLRKIIQNNLETISYIKDEGKITTLKEENAILSEFLPLTLSLENIESQLMSIKSDLVGAENDGKATGIAIKFMKESNANALSSDIAKAVKKIRS